MNKKVAIAITLVAAGMAIAGPVLLALELARVQGLDAETSRALTYAREALHRSEATTDQIAAGFARLDALPGDPCSPSKIALMQDIDVSSSYLQAVGYVTGSTMTCSSVAGAAVQLQLGPPDFTTRRGLIIRNNVTFPFAPKTPFLVVQEPPGYVAIVHKDLPVDVTTDESNVSLATFALANHAVYASRGAVQKRWFDALRDGWEATFSEDGFVIAVERSRRYEIGSVAAVPIRYLDQRTRHFAIILIPVGLLAGLVLAGAVLFLARQQLAMPAVLKTALRHDEFFLLYQPIVSLATGQWIGAEALIRWRRPNGELIRPDLFIPIAEDSGLIQRITERVFEIIERDAANLFRQYPDFHIAINLSAADLQSKRTVEKLRELYRKTGATPKNLIVEATERGFMKAEVAREVVKEVRASGIRVAIDDFGTGYSSLSYLEAFKIDFLKIDKSFVDTVGTGAATSQVVPHIIEMAKSLKLGMVAEGVETEAQAAFLRERGVQFAQGWLFGKPMPLVDVVGKLPTE